MEDYRLSDNKILKELKAKDKEIYNISRDLEKEKYKGEILAMEIKEVKCEQAQEQKEKIKYLKKDLKKKSRNDNRKEASTQNKGFDYEFRAQAFTSDRDLENHMITMHKETSESYSQTPDFN